MILIDPMLRDFQRTRVGHCRYFCSLLIWDRIVIGMI